MKLITVEAAYKSWSNDNEYRLVNGKEQSTITKKPLQKGDKYSLSCESSGATFAVIKNGNDSCISVIKKSENKEDKKMILVPIKEVHSTWKNGTFGYFYQDKAIATIAWSAKSNKYQLSFTDSSKIIVDASVKLQKAPKENAEAPAQTAAPKEDPTPAEAPAQTDAPKLTVDTVYKLVMELNSNDQRSLLASMIRLFTDSQKANLAYNLIGEVLGTALKTIETAAPKEDPTSAEAPAQTAAPKEDPTLAEAPAQTAAPKEDPTPAEAPKETLSKEYPDHYDRLVTWTKAKYPSVNIVDILKNWGNKEINGIKRVSCKQIGEKEGIGPATINEELSTICLLESLKHGVLIEYLTQSKIANIGENVKKLSATKQLEVYSFIIKLWENNTLSFNSINNAVKKYIKTNENSDVAYCLQVITGKKPLNK